jgi:hypothetical protein
MRWFLPFFCVVILTGCPTASFRQARQEGTEDAFRAFLAHHPDSRDAPAARQRLERLAYRRALASEDLAGYNRFLGEFPEGDLASEIRRLRGQARLAQAGNDAESLRLLLLRERHGPTLAEARARLQQLEGVEASEVDDPQRLRAYLLTYPEAPNRRVVEQRLDDLDYQAARASGDITSWQRYLTAHPQGIYRAEAEEALEAVEAQQVIASGRLGELEAFLRDHPGSVVAPQVKTATAAILWQLAERRLDPALARRVQELAPDGPHAEEAAQLAARWAQPNRQQRTIQQLVRDLTARTLEARPLAELRLAWAADDPRDAWTAVREIAFSDDPAAFDWAVEAAGQRDPAMLFYARAALSHQLAVAPERARERADHWETRLRPRSSNAADLLRLGAVQETMSDLSAAREAYQRAAQRPQTAVAGATHWALLALAHGQESEQQQALERLTESCRVRFDELLRGSPDELDQDRLPAALRVLRGLEGLQTLVQAVARALDQREGTAPAGADGVPRLDQALGAAQRRLEARISQSAPGFMPSAEDPLARRATETRRRRLEAARQLARRRPREAVPALLSVAGRDDSEVGRLALATLGRLPSPRSRQGLLALARQRPPTAHPEELARALGLVAERAPAEERQALVAAQNALAEAVEATVTGGEREE